MEKRNWMRSFHSWLVVVLVPIFYFLFSACLHAQNAKKEKVDLLVAGGTVVTMNAERRMIEDGAVAVNGDTVPEPNETFFVNLTGASGANVSDAQGQGTIINDDGVTAALTCPASPVPPNGSYTTTVSAGSAAKDWVAQYTPGSPNNLWIGQWKYVPLPRPATVTMTAPGTAGTYDLRLLANDGFVLIGSCTLQVQ